MKKENRGGARPGSGRPAIGRQKANFTTTVAPETKSRLDAIGSGRGKRGKFIDTAAENAYLLLSKDERFEVRVRNLIFSATDQSGSVFYGETVKELFYMMEEYKPDNEEMRLRFIDLMNAYKYGECEDGSLSRMFL